MPNPGLTSAQLRETAEAFQEHGTQQSAADSLGISRTSFQNRFRRAINEGYLEDPAIAEARENFGSHHRVNQVWLKDKGSSVHLVPKKPEENQASQTLQAIEDAASLPRLSPIEKTTGDRREDLLNLVTFADGHLGALCNHKESGSNWDLRIAEQVFTDGFRELIAEARPASKIFISFLGDWTDRELLEPITTWSGNVLDSDGRLDKMIRVAVRVMRRIMDEALQTHDEVEVLLAEGNHDPSGSRYMSEMFRVLYEENPRITFLDTEKPFYATTFGGTFLGFHHGHKVPAKKAENLALVMAHEFPEMYGQTQRRYIHTGHFHEAYETDVWGFRVRQHPTLATRSAWASRFGCAGIREANLMTYSSLGERHRDTVTPEMIVG